MTDTVLRVGHRSERSEIYGPGVRAVIWVQGCSLACPGCWNKEFWPQRGGEKVEVQQMLEWLRLCKDIEGVTLLGGEPLQQPEAVLGLIDGAKALGLSIFLYSGYSRHELNEIQLRCVENSDIVILGRYEEDKRDIGLRWRGSRNQVIEYISPRYSAKDWGDDFQEIEVFIDENGIISAYGYPDEEFQQKILDVL